MCNDSFDFNDENISENISIINKYNNEKLYKVFIASIKKILENYKTPNLLNQYKPKDGFEFIDKNNNETLGIYHSHLIKINSQLIVIVWYLKINDKDIYEIFIETINHPKDDYKSILKKIKEDNLTINPNTWDFFNKNI